MVLVADIYNFLLPFLKEHPELVIQDKKYIHVCNLSSKLMYLPPAEANFLSMSLTKSSTSCLAGSPMHKPFTLKVDWQKAENENKSKTKAGNIPFTIFIIPFLK